ncbi:helix-turn-helix domain-containing protein [Streptomyces chumphonensis]|uniref:Helix-turn-helix domain-containing protein n=1 Tax=Streptomyces chumphonensis TaxID=1214925 RepID=A0A927IC29_9ACTN|nr:helix-turn-helix domain-containing protein [Streptomyces chumphonensis]MBD3931169.1 helix-turn-helix domain-containing protein [Streptomyces chumphonensis]
MSPSRPSGPLTVAELVRFGPLSGAQVRAGSRLDRPVTGVSLISDLDQARRCAPETAMVLHPAAAHGSWALEAAMRFAWERNASCVVAPASVAVTGSTPQLAERLRMPLLSVADPARLALDLAVAVADTEAARARLIARCAVLFSERHNLRDIVGAINAEVPGALVALLTQEGHLLAGRAAAGRGDDQTGAHDRRVRVPVPGPDGGPWAVLVAQLTEASPSWADTVTTILKLARSSITAAGAGLRMSLSHQAGRDRLLLETLLRTGPGSAPTAPPPPGGAVGEEPGAVEPEAEQLAREAGWPVDGRHVAVRLRPAEPAAADLDGAAAGVIAAWQTGRFAAPLVPQNGGWTTWFTGTEPGQVSRLVGRRLAQARIPLPLTAGVGEPGEGLDGLRDSVAQAELAAVAASRRAPGTVERYAELGPRAVLAHLPVAELAAAARTLLAPLLADAKAEVLLVTLAALLDCAGSTGQTAARLGVHRNTVLGRLERIRARGVDPDAPDGRLALHLACHALLSTEPFATGRPSAL